MQRSYIGEDRVTFLLENKEKEGIIYYLSDMFFICKKIKKSDFEFKFYRKIDLNENSYCEIIQDRRFYPNLLRIIGKSLTLTCKFETKQLLENSYKTVSSIISQNKKESNKNVFYELIVLIQGTEQREINTKNEYTVYIIDIYQKKECLQRIFLRFSQLKDIDSYLSSLNIKLFKIDTKWENLVANYAMEKRKFQIEHYIQTLFSNFEFQQNPNPYVMELLGLQKNFFQLIGVDPKNELQINSLLNQEEIVYQPMIVPRYQKRTRDETGSMMNLYQSQNHQTSMRVSQKLPSVARMSSFQINDQVQVNILFHDGTELPINIPWNYLAVDLVQLIVSTIQLIDGCDFRIYEVQVKNKKKQKFTYMRPIANDESISSILSLKKKTGIFQRTIKKSFLFRKYLYFPEDILLFGQSKTRLRLIISQIFYEIKRSNLSFSLKDYCIFAALKQLFSSEKSQEINYKNIKSLIPSEIFKKQGKSDWVKIVSEIIKQISQDMNQLYLSNGLEQMYMKQSEKDEYIQQYNQQRYIQLCFMTFKLVSQNPLYGVTQYEVKLSKENLYYLGELLKNHKNGSQINIGISYQGLHIIDVNKKNQIELWDWSDIEEFSHYSDSISTKIQSKTILFETNQAFEIKNLAAEYEFLKQESKQN